MREEERQRSEFVLWRQPKGSERSLPRRVPVVELDTIRASDALGPGSSPGGHTKTETVFAVSVFLPSGTLRGLCRKSNAFTTLALTEFCFAKRKKIRELAPADTPKKNRFLPVLFLILYFPSFLLLLLGAEVGSAASLLIAASSLAASETSLKAGDDFLGLDFFFFFFSIS